MMAVLLDTVFTKMLPYIAPVIFILSAITVADNLRDLMVGAFTKSASTGRRT